MGVIIAITGKAGAGKSTILCNLACMYAGSGSTVGVLSCDLRYQSLPHFFGSLDIPVDKSLGKLFDRESLKDMFTEFEQMPNLFVSAPSAAENCFTYEPANEDGISRFLAMLSASFDYTLIEAGEMVFNQFSALAIKGSDVLVNVVENSLQGITFEQSSIQMLSMLSTEIIHVLNEPRALGIKEAARYLGHAVDVKIPYSSAILRAAKKGLPVMIDANAGLGSRRIEKAILSLHAQIGRKL